MAEESYVEIKKTQDEISKLLYDFQSEHKKLADEGKANSSNLVKMSEDFVKMSEAHQATVSRLEAEIKAREEMELAMSRMSENRASESKSNPDYIEGYKRYLKYRTAIGEDAINDEVKALVYDAAGMKMSDDEMRGIKTLLVGSNPDGGYLVPVERQATIKKRIFETTPMRQLATVVTIGTEATEFVLDDGEFGSEKVSELDTRNMTDTSQIGLIIIPTHEQSAQPVATEKILDDAIWNVEAWINQKIADKFSRVENHEFINGSQAREAQGILSLPDWNTLGVYQRYALETRDTSGAGGLFVADDLIDLQSDLLEPYQPNARWILHRKVWAEAMKLKDTQGQYLLNPQMLFAGVSMQMLGAPVVMSGDMPSTFEADNIIALYGDFREGYAIVDRIGIRVLRDPYTTKGVIKFWARKRTGGAVVNYQAIKRLAVPSNT
jgi:HK97 family phage major capsid protein